LLVVYTESTYDPDQQQKLITKLRECHPLPVAHAYNYRRPCLVESSLSAFVSYPTHRMRDWTITLLCQPWRS